MRPVEPTDAAQLAALHLDAYRGQHADWDAPFFDRLLLLNTTRGLVLEHNSMRGFILWQQLPEFGEIITLAVRADAQGQGIGRQLLAAYEAALARADIARSLLDVAEDNTAARALYERAGYAMLNRRAGYYKHYADGVETRVDALVMDKALGD